jgi:hypothetical protein
MQTIDRSALQNEENKRWEKLAMYTNIRIFLGHHEKGGEDKKMIVSNIILNFEFG